MLFNVFFMGLAFMVPAIQSQSDPPLSCTGFIYPCCNLPGVSVTSIAVTYNITAENNTNGSTRPRLDVKVTWDEPLAESDTAETFNGYGMCLHILRNDVPYVPPIGIFCEQVFGSCSYFLSRTNEYTYEDVLFGHNILLIIRRAKWNSDNTYEYLAARETAYEIATPDCYEETGDRTYCTKQPIIAASKPTDFTVVNFIRRDDTLADIVVTWREPAQINGILSNFQVYAQPEDDQYPVVGFRLDVTEGQRSMGSDVLYNGTLKEMYQNVSYTVSITASLERQAQGTYLILPVHIPILDKPPTTTTTWSPISKTPFFVNVITTHRTPAPIMSTFSGYVPITIAVIAVFAVAVVIVIIVIVLRKREAQRRALEKDYHAPDGYISTGKKTTNFVHGDNNKEVDPIFIEKEMERSKLMIENELGSGQFGIVYKATVFAMNGKKEEPKCVAVKGLKANASRAMKEDFLDEIKLIIEIGVHPNIVATLGCVTVDEPYYLVTEFMKYGDLLNFLWRCREEKYIAEDPIYNMADMNKLQICQQIARGMEFLSHTRYYHGDLAARNVLVGEGLVVKLSDFGMADDIYMRGYKRLAPERKRPVKWVSLETNTKGTCSIESDVWSYGIVLYEIYTLGGVPYPDIDGRSVVDRLLEGYRMEQPENCPSDVYDIMRKCWLVNPEERPGFHDLSETFDKMLTSHSDYIPVLMDGDEDTTTDEVIQSNQKTNKNRYVDMKTKAHRQDELNDYVQMKDQTQPEPIRAVIKDDEDSNNQDKHHNDIYEVDYSNTTPISHTYEEQLPGSVRTNQNNLVLDEKTKAYRQVSYEYVKMKDQELLERTGVTNNNTNVNKGFITDEDTYM